MIPERRACADLAFVYFRLALHIPIPSAEETATALLPCLSARASCTHELGMIYKALAFRGNGK